MKNCFLIQATVFVLYGEVTNSTVLYYCLCCTQAEAKILNTMGKQFPSLFALRERGITALWVSMLRANCPNTWDLLLNGYHT